MLKRRRLRVSAQIAVNIPPRTALTRKTAPKGRSAYSTSKEIERQETGPAYISDQNTVGLEKTKTPKSHIPNTPVRVAAIRAPIASFHRNSWRVLTIVNPTRAKNP